MTQPQYAPQFPQMPQQPDPAQAYAQYAPQFPQMPQQPDPAQAYAQYAPQQAYAQPQQAYAPNPYANPNAPTYAQAAYGPPQGYPMQQPAPQLATGTIDQFFAQPAAGGGAALKFDVGTRHVFVVSRPITNGDIQQQTQPGSGLPAFYKDGRPKFVMRVPALVHPSPQHPDGQAQWYCAGQASTELQRAMAEVGAPEGPPEHLSIIDVTCTHTRPSGQGMNPAKNYRIVYQRPNGAAPTAEQLPPPAVAVTPDHAHALAAAGVPLPANPQYAAAPPVAQQPPATVTYDPSQVTPAQMPQQVAPQQPPAQPAPPVAPPPVPAGAPEGLSPQQQALLAQLTGQATQT